MAATDLLARLQVLLDADTAEFDRNINNAADTADTGLSRISDKAKMMGIGLAAGAVAGGAALVAMTHQVIEAASEISTLSTLAGVSAEQLQYYAAGAATLGIEQENLADIFKDVNEKIGEFVATEGGGLSDFFENIAPKVGVTAEQFAKLSGPDALGLYVKSLEAANLSNEQMTFYMESFASDSTKLLPLLKNNSEGFKDIGDAALRYGAILDDDVIANSQKLEKMQYMLELQVKGLRNEVVAGVLPTMVDLGNAFATTTDNGVKLVGVGDIISTVMKGIAASALGAFATVDLLGTKLNELSGWKGLAKSFELKDLYTPGGMLNMANKALIGTSVARAPEADGSTEFDKKFETYAAKLDALWNPKPNKENLAALENLYNHTGNLGKKAADEAAKAASQASKAADTAAKSAQNAADQIQKAYESQESGLKRQIALFDVTTTAAQMKYDLENTEMAKFAPQQKAYLQRLAQELDYKKQDKAYSDAYKSASHEATGLKFKYDISRQIYDIQIQSNEKYKELSEIQRNTLVDMEVQNRLTSEYKSLISSTQSDEESRYQGLANQLSTINYALNAGAIDAAAYADQMQRIFDKSGVLPDFSGGSMDEAGIESAQMLLENKYMLESEARQRALDEKLMNEQAYQESVLNLELDYTMRKNDLEDRMKQAQLAKQQGYQDTAVSFFTKGLGVMASSTEKYAKVAKAAQKAMALYQVGKDTAAAAMAAYKAVVGIPIIGPTLAPIAAGAAIAFGALQAKAIMSDSANAATPNMPSSAAGSVTPIAEQQTVPEATRQTTTIQIPSDTLFTGRQMVDLLNDAIADGKRLDASAISFIGN